MAEPRAVRFTPGTMVPAGEYRNCDTGAVHYFDGSTPIPGSANSASWEQVSDHYRYRPERAAHTEHALHGSGGEHHVRFAAGTLVAAGEYRNVDTGAVHYFDGSTPLPGKANSASWEQVSDHYHHHPERAAHPEHEHGAAHPVRFAPGTVVAAGEYRNVETGAVRYFDGSTALPGTPNSASWEQIHDHYMPHPEHAGRGPGEGEAG